MTLQEYTKYATSTGAPALPNGLADGPKAVENFLIGVIQGCASAEESLNEVAGTKDNVYKWSINESQEFVGTVRSKVNLSSVSAV